MADMSIVLILSLAVYGCQGNLRWKLMPGLNDVTFTSDLLFSSVAKSTVHCASKCATTKHCVTFTFKRHTVASALCQGHSSVMTSSSASVSEPGAKSFKTVTDLQRLNCTTHDECFAVNSECFNGTCRCTFGYFYSVSTQTCQAGLRQVSCTTHGQCFAVNWECFKGSCVCTPGYFYSISTHTCQAACETANLQTSYMLYPGSYIVGYNLHDFSSTLDACMAACNLTTACRTFEYKAPSSACYIQAETPLTQPWDFVDTDPTYVLYQKNCA